MTKVELWNPNLGRNQLTHFTKFASKASGKDLSAWQSLHRWSVDHTEDFWGLFAQWSGLKLDGRVTELDADERAVHGDMLATRWFPDASLNVAFELMQGEGSQEVICSHAQGMPVLHFTRKELWQEVFRVQRFLADLGIEKGDCISGVLVNSWQAIVAMLATSSLGAVWSSCSPDFGLTGIGDRLAQVRPKVVFLSAEYVYGKKHIDCLSALEGLKQVLPTAESVVLCDHLFDRKNGVTASDKKRQAKLSSLAEEKQIGKIFHWSSQNESHNSHGFECIKSVKAITRLSDMRFVLCDFRHPLYIMFSSGTTGTPKCIVHSAGGTLLQHLKEHKLHCDLDAKDALFFFTTCGWMMWNWLVSALASKAKVVTYDGSVTHPSATILFDICKQEKVTVFGTSPKFLSLCEHSGLNFDDLKGEIRLLLSTGAPLLDSHFDWVYENQDSVQLASISGGTDIISCFVLGNPNLPVHKGQIQSAGLGMAVRVYNSQGESIENAFGELVCEKAFPSMPIHFLHDKEDRRYLSSYFDRFTKEGSESEKIWCHGDFMLFDRKTGGFSISGRSDATLNPGGVRIGTAEIYRVVESLNGVEDSIVAGLTRDGDIEVCLFVRFADGRSELTVEEEREIKLQIKRELTPRHVPKYLFAVMQIPLTRNGKKMELAVRSALHGEKQTNASSMLNPQAIEEYLQIGQNLL